MNIESQRNQWPHRVAALRTAALDDEKENEDEEFDGGDYSYEQEMNLLPGAPVKLHDVEIFHPITKKWHSLMDEPQRRMASQM